MITPTVDMLLSEILSVKSIHPSLSNKKVSVTIKEHHPDWLCNAKRVSAILKSYHSQDDKNRTVSIDGPAAVNSSNDSNNEEEEEDDFVHIHKSEVPEVIPPVTNKKQWKLF